MLPLKKGQTIDKRITELETEHKRLDKRRGKLTDELHDTSAKLSLVAQEIKHWRKQTQGE